MWLVAYGAATSAGPTSTHLWNQLARGANSSCPIPLQLLKNKPDVLPDYRIHLRLDLPVTLTHRQRLLHLLQEAWSEVCGKISPQDFHARMGIIFTSTKGFAEDFVWKSDSFVDGLTPLLHDFIKEQKLAPQETLVLSEACSSVAAAVTMAEEWLNLEMVDHVLVLSCDSIGEFVIRGFHSLHALTPRSQAQPFDKERLGLQLGEAAAVLLLSKKIPGPSMISAKICCEGVAATRPDRHGRSLQTALSQVIGDKALPVLIIAHGTGTVINDVTEDSVFQNIYSQKSAPPPSVTSLKWSIGHTLAVSCALDIIAAQECLTHGRAFALAQTQTVDETFRSNYLLKTWEKPLSAVLVSSLGFGGVHGGVYLQRSPDV